MVGHTAGPGSRGARVGGGEGGGAAIGRVMVGWTRGRVRGAEGLAGGVGRVWGGVMGGGGGQEGRGGRGRIRGAEPWCGRGVGSLGGGHGGGGFWGGGGKGAEHLPVRGHERSVSRFSGHLTRARGWGVKQGRGGVIEAPGRGNISESWVYDVALFGGREGA